MICQNCHKNVATVTVIEIPPSDASGQGQPHPVEQQLCEMCAQARNLPHAPVQKKTLGDIWKLLQNSSQKPLGEPGVTCPECGMTREEFRMKGRIGCARDYEIFAEDVNEILERVHGSTHHVGRAPGVSPEELTRMRSITCLKRDLDVAIRDEAYENAARIRDELRELEGSA